MDGLAIYTLYDDATVACIRQSSTDYDLVWITTLTNDLFRRCDAAQCLLVKQHTTTHVTYFEASKITRALVWVVLLIVQA